MPLKFWDEAFATAVFIINRLPSKVIVDHTPFECLFGNQPNYNFFRTFGCAVWPNLRPYNSKKLQFRSKQCVFLGYSNMHKGFKCLDPKEGRVYISRDVVFDETVFPFASLHPNAGARLRSELALLPDILKKRSSDFRDANLHDPHLLSPASTNELPKSGGVVAETGTGTMPAVHHFMCSPSGSYPPNEADPVAAASGSSGGRPRDQEAWSGRACRLPRLVTRGGAPLDPLRHL